MFRRLRIAILLYVLLFVAVGQYLTQRHARAWNEPLWVDVYPVAADAAPATKAYIAALDGADFATIERFFAKQAARYELDVDSPFRISLAPPLEQRPPDAADDAGLFGVLLWSLRMRWFTTRLAWSSDRPRPDIVVYAVYHAARDGARLDDSHALRKGLVVVANLFADDTGKHTNHVVIAHELLHTVGASDKYDPVTLAPLYPGGYAEPGAEPLHPQRRAELMGGRVPLAPSRAEIPSGLDSVVVGPATAAEIGWRDAE